MRRIAVAVATISLLALACGGGEEDPAPPPPPANDDAAADATDADDADDDAAADDEQTGKVGKGKVGKMRMGKGKAAGVEATSFASTKFNCCANSAVSGVLGEYLDLHAAVHSDNSSRAKAELHSLSGNADKCRRTGVSTDITKLCTNIENAADNLKSQTYSDIQAKMPDLGSYMMALAKRQKGSGQHEVALVHCQQNDAYWLQKETTIQSPFGGELANCGAFVELEE